MSKCNQDGHFGHNCAALINNYNGSFFLFYMNCCHLWVDCLLDWTLKSPYCAATLEASIFHPSVRVCALSCATALPAGAHSLSELPLICQLDSVLFLKVTCGLSEAPVTLGAVTVNKRSSYFSQSFCTDNTEPHRKACEIIFITSSLSTSS